MWLFIPTSKYWYCQIYGIYRINTYKSRQKTNMLFFFMGDFNIDLLKYESHNYTNDFINSLVFTLLSAIYSSTN